MRKINGVDPDGMEGGDEPGGVEGGEIVSDYIVCEKESIFSRRIQRRNN